MHERARIARFFAPLAAAEPGSFQLTDDAAALSPPPDSSLVVTTDSVIQGIHVLADATPKQYAQKLVRRNVSDLAAMGATPWRYTLNLHTPAGLSDDWFGAFAAALEAEQDAFAMVLVGGDSTSGGDVIHATMTCFGLADGPVLRRAGAQVGDDVYISGTVGDAAAGLLLLQQTLQQQDAENAALIARYHRPEPRLALGVALRNVASACIDISDGLLADIAQICTASGVGATIARETIALSPMLQQRVQQQPALWDVVLQGGDDYELCFTAPHTARAQIEAIAAQLELKLTRIGEITADAKIVVVDAQGTALDVAMGGWEYR